MDTRIIVQAKNVYGRMLLYPVNEQAKNLAALAGQSTLTTHHLAVARAMGFSITEQGLTLGLTETRAGSAK